MNNTSRPRISGNTSSLSDPPRSRAGDRYRNFVFTLNNWTEEEYLWITTTFAEKYAPTWMIVAKETGEEGTPHLQGAVILGTQRAFSTIKMWPGFRRAHLERMCGRPLDSKIYCSKQDLHPFEIGDLPSPGKRNDLALAVQAIEEGRTLSELARSDGAAVVKFYKGLTMLRSLRSAPRDPAKPPTIYWLYGPTGTGKTKCAWEFGAAHGATTDVYLTLGTLQWFDGYDGQRIVIVDDFRSKGTAFNFLLRLCDRYPISVPFKGGFVNWNPDVIIFTTPHCIRNTFAERLEHRPEDVRQLERRVTMEYSFPTEEPQFRMLFAPPQPDGLVNLLGEPFPDDEELELSQDLQGTPPTEEFTPVFRSPRHLIDLTNDESSSDEDSEDSYIHLTETRK